MSAPAVPPSLRVHHAALAPLAAELLDLAVDRPEMLDVSDREVRALPGWGMEFPYPIQLWPTFLSGPRLAEIRRASLAVPKLVKAIPRRVFGDDLEAMAEFYGVRDVGVLRAILSEPDGIDSALARPDFVDTEDGFFCLEVNLTASLGGWQLRFLVERLMALPWLREIVRDVDGSLSLFDPLPALVRHLSAQGRRSGAAPGDRLDTAFVLPDTEFRNRVRPMIDVMAGGYDSLVAGIDGRTGGRLVCVRHTELAMEEGRIVVDGRPVNAAIEYQRAVGDPRLFRCFKAGTLDLYNGPAAVVLRDKRNLALLSESVESDLLDPEEREVVRRHVPWTRTARPGSTRYRCETVDLPGIVVRHRERFVLKPAGGSRGEAIRIGDETAPSDWEAAVRRAFESRRWVVQERLRSKPYLYPGPGGRLVPHVVIWGMFAFGDRYGGGFLRMMPNDAGAVVNAARGAREGLIAEIEDGLGPRP